MVRRLRGAIVAACEDAGIDPRDVDGFVSYGSERNDGQKLMPALGTRELRFEALVWRHGGGISGMRVPEAVRQICGESPTWVPGSRLSLKTGGPQDDVVSHALFGSHEPL